MLSLWLLLMPVAVETPLADASQEARAQAIIRQMRCMVCSGQPLAGSQAAMAVEMRQMVREMVIREQSDEQITDFFTRSYGHEIWLSPPVNATTSLLWTFPLLGLAIGAGILLKQQRNRL